VGKLEKYKNDANLKERGVSILASLSFHALLLFFLVKIVPPVKMYLYRQVADVRIASPEGLYFPRIAGVSGEPAAPEEFPQSIARQEGSPGEPVREEMESIEPGVVYLRNLAFGREREQEDVSQTAPAFNLIPDPRSKGRFSLEISREKPESEEGDNKAKSVDFDATAFGSSALSTLKFERVVTSTAGESAGQLSQNMLIEQQGVDISPWVRGVVDKIRDNWELPPIAEALSIGDVKIRAVFGKQGNLVSLAIVDSSDFLVFDRTAMDAIRASAPFSRFPDSFPFDTLEAYLVFQFNE
jgi:outer membrane biosynthesis protein TonB